MGIADSFVGGVREGNWPPTTASRRVARVITVNDHDKPTVTPMRAGSTKWGSSARDRRDGAGISRREASQRANAQGSQGVPTGSTWP